MKHLIKTIAIVILQLCSTLCHAQLTCSIVKMEAHKYDSSKVLLSLDIENTSDDTLYLNYFQVKTLYADISNKLADTANMYIDEDCCINAFIVVNHAATEPLPPDTLGMLNFSQRTVDKVREYETEFNKQVPDNAVLLGLHKFILLAPHRHVPVNTIMYLGKSFTRENALLPENDNKQLQADMYVVMQYYSNSLSLLSQRIQLRNNEGIKNAVLRSWQNIE